MGENSVAAGGLPRVPCRLGWGGCSLGALLPSGSGVWQRSEWPEWVIFR